MRFCVSAAHTKADLDRILVATDDVGTVLGLKLSPRPERVPIDEVIRTGVETVRETERQYDEALMQLQQLSDAESQSQ